MHVPDCSGNSQVEINGGFSVVYQSTYEGYQVAVKVVNVRYDTLNTVLSVSGLPFPSSRPAV